MNYYYDTEFLEGTQKRRLGKIELPKMFDTKNTIDLISIGIVSEKGKEYYAINKEFNLKEAWNRYDLKVQQVYGDARNIYPEGIEYKVYWIRENVLRPIFQEWKAEMNGKIVRVGLPIGLNEMPFNYKNFKYCIECIGKTNKQIADEVKDFVYGYTNIYPNDVSFYGYYSAYDHVALCWLFGKMIDLPKGFPMYTRDLKQMLEEKQENQGRPKRVRLSINLRPDDVIREYTMQESTIRQWGLDKEIEIDLKKHPHYPKETNIHNALEDARWNKELHKFLNEL